LLVVVGDLLASCHGHERVSGYAFGGRLSIFRIFGGGE
jgi:hypothetical protein